MCSRIRKISSRVFDAYFEICIPSDIQSSQTAIREPFVIGKYPQSFNDEEIVKFVLQSSYPCSFTPTTVTHYSFVLTSIDSKWTFGYCRHSPEPGNICLVLLSSLPWHDTFYKLLNNLYSLRCKEDKLFLNKFLEALYEVQVPEPGSQLKIVYYVNAKEYEVTAQCPDHLKIPSIPEDRNLSEFYNAVDSYNMIVMFASMLNERRILVTSKKLSRLSACVQAANSLIYPMHWQHIFIPVLPTSMLDYLTAPMPFLIGVPSVTMTRVKRAELGELVILDADENKIETPFDDVHTLPTDIVSFLKKNLRNTNLMVSDGVARTFLKALVMLIGGYRDALKMSPGQKITFSKENFIVSRPTSIQPFLQRMLHLQIFQQFIEGRLAMLNEGEGFGDEFEIEVNMYEDRNSNRLKTQYREWMGAMKKEGGAIFKSVNPAMKSAYKQVKDKGKIVKDKSKQAYKDIRSKMHKPGHSSESLPRSAPSSPRGSICELEGETEHLSSVVSRKGIKKSMSGVFNETEKAMVYLRNKADLKNHNVMKNIYINGTRNKAHLLESNAGNGKLAPEASSEDSDVDFGDSDEFKYKPINMDLMTDLHDLLFKRCSVDSPGNISKIKSNSDSLLDMECSSGTSSNSSQLLAPPIAPPRNAQKPCTKKLSHDNLLIELDSPPDDVTTLFDPLSEVNNANATDKSRNSNSSLLPNAKFYTPQPMNLLHTQTSAATTRPVSETGYKSYLSPMDVRRSALTLSSTLNSNSTNPFETDTCVNISHMNPKEVAPNNITVNENVRNTFTRNWQQFE
ncbi:DENN domain-containing protein 1A-like protein [Leptotrombidium deliense]|uniref:DENN domain-containing protein 1A-like protein n=1 Tax=Leptotrombidium deliense TaxID=299467 RepID=A0A443SU26_9ACAR|nr:DENN domain-containing protein 1A-like protein [Leptotrombidium deliense]